MRKMTNQRRAADCRAGIDPSVGDRRRAWLALTWADKVLIAAVLLCTAGWETGRHLGALPGGEAVVEVDGTRRAVLPLDQPRKVRIEGFAGSCEVEIGAQGARILRASCPHGICVRRGWVRREGEVVVCVPNRLVLTIVGGEEPSDVDAVVR